jgi:hypothetical protein
MTTYPDFFRTCQTFEEGRTLYRKLARENHPDFGGDLRTMQEINAQWAVFQSQAAYREARTRQTEAHAAGKKSAADYHDLDEIAEALRIKIEALLNISPEITVELCGLWIWVTGETKKHHEAIKAVEGMRYASEKQAWFYPGVPSFNRKKRSMDEIRGMHGSQVFSRQADDDNPKQSASIGA